jgi:hypothetical protein
VTDLLRAAKIGSAESNWPYAINLRKAFKISACLGTNKSTD